MSMMIARPQISAGLRGLGTTGCPTGQKMKVTYGGTVGSTAPLYECVNAMEESLLCTLFGWNCSTPAAYAPAPASPQTQTQMTVPGAWTPDQSSLQTNQDFLNMIAAYNAQNPGGIATVPSALSQTGDAVTDVLASKTTWLALGAVAAVALLIALKR